MVTKVSSSSSENITGLGRGREGKRIFWGFGKRDGMVKKWRRQDGVEDEHRG